MIISIDNARQGLIIGENIYKRDDDKFPIVLSGTVLTAKLIENLKRIGITKITIIKSQEYAQDVEETISSPQRKVLTESLRVLNFKDIMTSAEEIVNKVLNTKHIQYSLSRYIYEEETIYAHAVNVCIFSVALGKAYNENCPNRNYRVNLLDLAYAALLHNVGKICENSDILAKLEPIKLDRNKFPGFDPECFIRYNKDMHVVYTYSLLRNNPLITQAIKTTILFSQENEKGTGTLGAGVDFTQRRETSMIMAKIIHIAAMYDDLLFKVLKKGGKDRRESPSNVIEILQYAKKNGLVNIELVNLFFRTVPLYSIGCRVKLSDDNIGTVVDLNEDYLAEPCVQLDSTGMIIDLSGTTNVTIACISDNELIEN